MHQAGTLRSHFIKLDLPIDRLPDELHGMPVYLNPRLSRALGRFCIRRDKMERFKMNHYVELSPVILPKVGLLREVVAHEAAHACTPRESHSYPWRRWCIDLGGTGRVLIPHADLAGLRVEHLKVVGRCAVCSHEFRQARALHSNRAYTHTGCGGAVIPSKG